MKVTKTVLISELYIDLCFTNERKKDEGRGKAELKKTEE
jgi:hypothetical protein